mmetsp:Transcript_12248/g.31055  ORF Transcript_12248/g.31055 Transcript_12248/m.31055 type:complete len:229 (+) Transcript_12248:313-999(+)
MQVLKGEGALVRIDDAFAVGRRALFAAFPRCFLLLGFHQKIVEQKVVARDCGLSFEQCQGVFTNPTTTGFQQGRNLGANQLALHLQYLAAVLRFVHLLIDAVCDSLDVSEGSFETGSVLMRFGCLAQQLLDQQNVARDLLNRKNQIIGQAERTALFAYRRRPDKITKERICLGALANGGHGVRVVRNIRRVASEVLHQRLEDVTYDASLRLLGPPLAQDPKLQLLVEE